MKFTLVEILLYCGLIIILPIILKEFVEKKELKEKFLRLPIISIIHDHIVTYPTPSNINYFWSFGSLAGLCLVLQIITGIFLAMHYTPHVNNAFNSVEHIMRDVNNGWLLRYLHANGASIFFAVVYAHMGRGIYFGSFKYPRRSLWLSGIILFILMMATAFMGYVLPWGQMSFWGATVITNLFSAIPIYGEQITYWLWGGFSVDNATLNRFFSLHYLLPFVITGLVLVHLILLHQVGSNNPLGIDPRFDQISFYPYFYVKDLFSLLILLTILMSLVIYNPNLLGHPDNYTEANALVTPAHIVPEWYFLPFYAILRAVPNKFWGVAYLAGSIMLLIFLPLSNEAPILSARFRPIFKLFFWLWISIVVLLGWLGAQPIEYPYLGLSRFGTTLYFIILGMLFSRIDRFEYSLFLASFKSESQNK